MSTIEILISWLDDNNIRRSNLVIEDSNECEYYVGIKNHVLHILSNKINVYSIDRTLIEEISIYDTKIFARLKELIF
jgi:hypothetical protein